MNIVNSQKIKAGNSDNCNPVIVTLLFYRNLTTTFGF